MGTRSRPLAIVALAILVLALPSIGLAGNPPTRHALPGAKPNLKPTAVSGPTLVPGAAMKSIGFGSLPFGPAAGTVVADNPVSGIWDFYDSSTNGELDYPLGLPAGATVWQIDVYGYRTDTNPQNWTLWDEHPADGNVYGISATATTSAGPGEVQGTMSFPSGLVTATGHNWLVGLSVTNVDTAVVGVIVQYTLPSLALVPISPVRVFDSRISRFGGPITKGSPRTINVKDAINPTTGVVTLSNAIPQGARAISYNVTVTGTVGAGYLDVLPGANTTVTGSTINWTGSGVTIANGGLVSLGTGTNERKITLVLGAGTKANVIIDITGYYW